MNGTAVTMASTTSNSSMIRMLSTAETGTPAWVDLGTAAGTATAARFYCSLFGWTVVARHRPMDESAGYWVFQQGETAVGGLAANETTAWTMYVRVDDVAATMHAAAERGGAVVAEPVRTVDGGWMAVCADPCGARFAVWQPAPSADAATPPHAVLPPAAGAASGRRGYQLLCGDVEAAADFYREVLGWVAETVPCAGRTRCVRFRHPATAEPLAMVVQMGTGGGPDGTPARWTVHLPVADADEAVVRVAELGGSVSVEPFDLPDVGRVAVLDDPEHATFSILQAA